MFSNKGKVVPFRCMWIYNSLSRCLKPVLVSQNKTIIRINPVCMCSSTTYVSKNEDRSSIMNMNVRYLYNREIREED